MMTLEELEARYKKLLKKDEELNDRELNIIKNCYEYVSEEELEKIEKECKNESCILDKLESIKNKKIEEQEKRIEDNNNDISI